MSATAQERHDRLVLSLIFEPGDLRIRRLVEQFGASQSLEMIRANLLDDTIVTDAGQRLPEIRPTAVLDHAAQIGARFIVPGDDEWPTELDDLRHVGQLSERGGVPLGLWVRGERLDALMPRVAIVGSRAATTYGTDAAATVAAEVAQAGWVVVSGGAYGIDAAAHRGALSVGAPTIVALAHGLDRVYPVGNTELVEAAARRGSLISELAPGTAPMPLRFLARNRVIAGVSRGTVVVEASTRSGALNTANWTSQLSRPLLAVPGPSTSSVSLGTHDLIRSGAAVLATTGEEVLEVVDGTGRSLVAPGRAPVRRRDRLDTRTRQLFEAVPAVQPRDLSSIATTAGIGVVDAQRMMTRLEEQALVTFEAGGWRLSDAARASES